MDLDESKHNTAASITFQNLYKGEGLELGRVMRGFLYSCVPSYAITDISIVGIDHIFTAIPKIQEDVIHIISNLKKIIFKVPTNLDCDSFQINLKAEQGDVHASDFELPENIEIINPTQLICTITEKTTFDLTCIVNKGIGFISEEESMHASSENDMHFIGGNFNPITNVTYKIKDIASGHTVALEELELRVETNGSVDPVEAVKIVVSRIDSILKKFNEHTINNALHGKYNPLKQKLMEDIEVLQLSPRALKCLVSLNIKTLKDLVIYNIDELLKHDNFGPKSVEHIEEQLREHGLHLGMVLHNV